MKKAEFMQEAQLMKKLHHPNLLQLFGVCVESGKPFYIVTELMKHGSLLEYLKCGEGRKITVHQTLDFILQISSGKFHVQLVKKLISRQELGGEYPHKMQKKWYMLICEQLKCNKNTSKPLGVIKSNL